MVKKVVFWDRKSKLAQVKAKRNKKPSPKQIAQRKKFKKATQKCKGKSDYRSCMKIQLKK